MFTSHDIQIQDAIDRKIIIQEKMYGEKEWKITNVFDDMYDTISIYASQATFPVEGDPCKMTLGKKELHINIFPNTTIGAMRKNMIIETNINPNNAIYELEKAKKAEQDAKNILKWLQRRTVVIKKELRNITKNNRSKK